MIKVENLVYNDLSYNELNDVNFEVNKGEVSVVIGENGCGKSLLLKVIAEPHIDYAGRITVAHFRAKTEPEKAKANVGYLPKPVVVEPFLTGFEYLETIAAFHGLEPKDRREKILKLATELGCKDYLYTLLERMGPAMSQKVGIIASLIHEPSVILWDEPLLHLDPTSQRAALRLLQKAVSKGASALIATNDLHLAEDVADRLIILKDGQIQYEGTIKQIHNLIKSPKVDLPSMYQHVFGE